jgi:MYXO-CTERM domain-containing protein
MNGKTLFAATAALTAFALTTGAMAEVKSYQGQGGILNDAGSDSNFNTIPGTTRFEIFVPDHGSITDFQGVDLNVFHTWVGDLTIVLTHKDSGTSLVLTDRPGVPASSFGNSDDLGGLYIFADGNPLLPETSAGGVIANGAYGAEGGSLSVFNGLDKFGTWSLHFTDSAGGDTGELLDWGFSLANVPAPGAMALLGLAGLVGGRRRRA